MSRQGTSKNMRMCPLASRIDRGTFYRPYCWSTKFPGADNKNGIIVTDEDLMGLCLGHTINKKNYTSCKYYKGGKPNRTMYKK